MQPGDEKFSKCRSMNKRFNWLPKPWSERNSFASIRARRPWRVIRGRTLLAGMLMLLLFSNAFAESDFSTFWKNFKSAVIAGDKATVAEMTKFPVSMPAFQKAIRNKADFLRRYDEIFKGEASAANVFPAPNRTNNPPGSTTFTARSRRHPTTGKTHRFASFLNRAKAAGNLPASTILMNNRHEFHRSA